MIKIPLLVDHLHLWALYTQSQLGLKHCHLKTARVNRVSTGMYEYTQQLINTSNITAGVMDNVKAQIN